ncbi:MAG: hypothetical protein ACREUF_18910 [Solimonas sp.]
MLALEAADVGGPVSKSPAARLEVISGSTAKRVILSAKAAERLGIETGKVGEAPIMRRQMVSGLVVAPFEKQPESKPAGGTFGGYGRIAAPAAQEPAGLAKPGIGFGGFAKVAAAPAVQPVAAPATSPANGDVWVLVTLSPAEWDRLAKDKPARLLPLATREKLKNEVLAQPSGMPALEDTKRSMLSLHYVVPGKNHGLALNSRMRVELPLLGSDDKQKVVPYGAVYYDAKGAAWVYVNATPLVFARQRISIERVVGDLAVLSEGPPVGTPVVTTGAALLYGVEIFGK